MPTAARTDAEFAARFWAKVERTPGCWIWLGARTAAGYGSLRRNQRPLYAHRVSYEMANGPLGEDECVLHRCDTPWCVRPDHLFAGTKADNNQDCAAKTRGNGRPASPVARLTDAQVLEIRRVYAEGETSQRELADRHGVAQMTISKIVRRESWRRL